MNEYKNDRTPDHPRRKPTPGFDRDEHSFLMEAKKTGAAMIFHQKDSAAETGCVMSFGPRCIRVARYDGTHVLLYKSGIVKIEPAESGSGL